MSRWHTPTEARLDNRMIQFKVVNVLGCVGLEQQRTICPLCLYWSVFVIRRQKLVIKIMNKWFVGGFQCGIYPCKYSSNCFYVGYFCNVLMYFLHDAQAEMLFPWGLSVLNLCLYPTEGAVYTYASSLRHVFNNCAELNTSTSNILVYAQGPFSSSPVVHIYTIDLWM